MASRAPVGKPRLVHMGTQGSKEQQKDKCQGTSTFRISTWVTFANVPFVISSFMTKPRISIDGCGHRNGNMVAAWQSVKKRRALILSWWSVHLQNYLVGNLVHSF